MKSAVIAFSVGVLVALTMGDPLRLGAQQRKPSGTCPPKDPANPVYLPDDEDCTIFYECSGGEPVQKECLPNLCFDPTLNVCAFPNTNYKSKAIEVFEARDAVGKCPPRDGNTTTYLTDSKNCSVYYICSNGQAIKQECLPDMSWNSKLNTCDWSVDIDCEAGFREFTFSPYTPIGTCPPRDTNQTTYLVDSANCSIYYVCSNGQPIPQECTVDMNWNSKLNICDWAVDVPCDLPELMSFEMSESRSPVGSCPPRDGNTTTYLTDSKDCAVYYICSNGQAIGQECLPNMAWNPKLNTCDWAIDVDCDSGFREFTFAPYTPIGTCPPRDTNQTTYLVDSANCSIYYVCSNGRPIPQECTVDMNWNSKLNICDWAVDVPCDLPISDKSIIAESVVRSLPRSAVGACPEHDGEFPIYLPDSEYCSLYYECSGGIPILNNCPDELEFSPLLNVCVDPLDSDCKATGTGTPPPSNQTTPTTSSSSTTTAAPQHHIA